jgi:hypothetical protein
MTIALTIASLRLSWLDAANVRWYCLEAAGDLGLKSNLGPMLDNLEMGSQRHKGSKPVIRAFYDLGSHAHEADTARLVEQRLAQLDPVDRRTLVAAYGTELPDKAAEHWRWLVEECPISGLTIPLLLVTAERLGIGRRQLRSWHEASDPCVKKKRRPHLKVLTRLGRSVGPRCGAGQGACNSRTGADETGVLASVLEEPVPSRPQRRLPRCTSLDGRQEFEPCARSIVHAPCGEWPRESRCQEGRLREELCTLDAHPTCQLGTTCLSALAVACRVEWPAEWMTLERLWDDAEIALVQACRAYTAVVRGENSKVRQVRQEAQTDGFGVEG